MPDFGTNTKPDSNVATPATTLSTDQSKAEPTDQTPAPASADPADTTTQTHAVVPQPPPPPNRTIPDWWVAVSLITPFLTLLLGYWLGQRATRTNNVATLVKDDITSFRTKIEAYIALVKAHQRGNPVDGTPNLNKSREYLTLLRKDAASAHRQIRSAIENATHQNEWKLAYIDWKQATEGESGLITRKTDAWSPDAIAKLEDTNEKYLETINRYRRQIASHKIKLAS